jgi:hypothetical protein
LNLACYLALNLNENEFCHMSDSTGLSQTYAQVEGVQVLWYCDMWNILILRQERPLRPLRPLLDTSCPLGCPCVALDREVIVLLRKPGDDQLEQAKGISYNTI